MHVEKIVNYYEQSPEENTFMDIMADITHKCNMTCKNCYIPNRDVPDMDLEKFRDFLSRLDGRCMIRIVGAEPTMNPRCDDYIKAVFEFEHRCILLTNGLRLAHKSYVDKIHDSGLRHVYLSLNGVDNDDWYEAIDELRCAEKKISALRNLKKRKFILDTGTIIVPGVNEDAPGALLELFDKENINNVLMRIKNVGQLGRYQTEVDDNVKLNQLVKLCAEQMNVSEDYINSFRDAKLYGMYQESNSILFPLREGNKVLNRGRWVKITNWDTDNESGIPDPNSQRRGRITENFTVAPLYEHIKMNEGGY
jgi:molybdenum cofactor biosynthesis enzyme MoaA